jgi:peptidylprolyl isomerase
MTLKRLFPALIVSSTLLLAACGSDDGDSGSTTTAAGCPTEAPAQDVAADWTLSGTTGSLEVTGPTDTTAPEVTVTTPFSVDTTQVQTLTEGTGEVVPATAEVSVCYMGVNGRDGTVFDSSYERGTPADFPLSGVIPGFQKAITGQRVGSTVAVAMAPADGYASGNPRAGIEAGDSLVFALEIVSAQG